MSRLFALTFSLLSFAVFAQGEEPRVIVVPVPADPSATPPIIVDAGTPVAAPTPPVEPALPVQPAPAEPAPAVPPTPPPEVAPPPTDAPKMIEAKPVPSEQTPPVPDEAKLPEQPAATSAMLDGHPREGAFLSGPGSLTFVLHHTLMGGVGVLATQMVPRLITSASTGAPAPFGPDDRLAYLAGTLIGAGIGFGSSAFWQFNHWISHNTANFGIVNSLVGAMFMSGFVNLFTTDAPAVAWFGLFGAELGAWLTTLIGGGDLALNKGLLITSGAVWAEIYTALILAVVATTGGGANARAGVDALMITPALGAAAMALACLKFDPSTSQILRADVFGAGVGAGVLLLSALVLGAKFNHPLPYILSGVGAAGAIVTVSLLWAEGADAPPAGNAYYRSREKDRPYATVWW